MELPPGARLPQTRQPCLVYRDEGRQILEASGTVEIGRNCVIDPSAVIHGPTSIGDNVTVGAGAVIETRTIGKMLRAPRLPAHAFSGWRRHFPAVSRFAVHDHHHG